MDAKEWWGQVSAQTVGNLLALMVAGAMSGGAIGYFAGAPTWAYILYAIGGALIVLLFLDLRKRQAESKPPELNPAFKNNISLESAGVFISMEEASIRLYKEALSNNWALAKAADHMSGKDYTPGSPNDRLDHIATEIARKIRVWGKKHPSRELAQISEHDVKESSFVEGATKLANDWFPESIYWTDLAVMSDDFNDLIGQMHFDSGFERS